MLRTSRFAKLLLLLLSNNRHVRQDIRAIIGGSMRETFVSENAIVKTKLNSVTLQKAIAQTIQRNRENSKRDLVLPFTVRDIPAGAKAYGICSQLTDI